MNAGSVWRRVSGWPGGRWLYSRLVCWKAPYFASIRPMFVDLQAGRCIVRMRKRRAVLNHIGTVHAIAMCNLAELAAGTMIDSTLPPSHRWIPKGMTVEYLRRPRATCRPLRPSSRCRRSAMPPSSSSPSR
jgi:acyl-coenzyme A thioesterase PaaI-like protein